MFRRLRQLLSSSLDVEVSVQADPTAEVRQVRADPTFEVRKVRGVTFDRSENVVEVVGESYRQDALELISGGRGLTGMRVVDHVAGLRPETDNPVDPEAVEVQISAHRVGYLGRTDARAYRPVIDRLARHGLSMACPASLKGGWDQGSGDVGSIGVRLHVGTPAELWAEIDEMFGPEQPPSVLRATRPPAVAITVEWDGVYEGKSVCFTGPSGFEFRGNPVTRGMQELLAVQHGMTVRPGVSRKVEILVIGRNHPRTNKVKKAEELGTMIVDEAAFWSRLGVTFDG